MAKPKAIKLISDKRKYKFVFGNKGLPAEHWILYYSKKFENADVLDKSRFKKSNKMCYLSKTICFCVIIIRDVGIFKCGNYKINYRIGIRLIFFFVVYSTNISYKTYFMNCIHICFNPFFFNLLFLGILNWYNTQFFRS